MEKRARFVNSLTFQMDVTARIFHNLVESYFNQDVKNRITLDEYIVLDTIVCYPQIDRNTIAKTLIKDKAFVDKILAKLIHRKLIKAVKNSSGTIQVKFYELTKEGNRIYQEIIPKKDRMIEVLARFMSQTELLSFTKTLLKIRNILISLSDVDYKN